MLTTKARPKTFANMVGQDRPVAVLRSVLKHSDIPSTFLFHGVSGSGKTTAARILAAAVNCEQPNHGDACGQCPSCVSIANGTSDALLELDAAVVGSTDNVRDLTELVSLTTRHRYRVIVLDECHALHKQAFNALLKLMEEAPDTVVFVLATTDAHKVPDTVKTRALSFYFGPIPPANIREHLSAIVADMGKTVDNEALTTLSHYVESMRDAVKIIDVASQGVDHITLTHVEPFVGNPEEAKNVLRVAVQGKDVSEDDLILLATKTNPMMVMEVWAEVFTTLYTKKAISTATYQNVMDMVWDMHLVKSFDHRGLTITRTILRRVAALFARVVESTT